MRTLNRNETRLLLFFGLCIGAAVAFFLFVFLKNSGRSMDEELVKLRNERIEASAWLEEKDRWTERKQWLDAHQPQFPSDGTASSSLLQSMQESARKNGVNIAEQSLPEPVINANYHEVSVRLRVDGNLEQLARWLTEIQRPEAFQALTGFTIKSDKEPPKVICDLQVARWYAP